MIWVAIAGPVTNLLLAFGSVLVLKVLLSLSDGSLSSFWLAIVNPLALMAKNSLVINILLAVFNIFPIPPLDGGRVLVGLLPEPHSSTVARVEPYGILVLMVLLFTGVVGVIIRPIFHFLLAMFLGML